MASDLGLNEGQRKALHDVFDRNQSFRRQRLQEIQQLREQTGAEIRNIYLSHAAQLGLLAGNDVGYAFAAMRQARPDAVTAGLATALVLIGAGSKAGLVPLHVWLPDSMEGPTPISALIHAATMVTAGVYLIARMNPLYHYAPLVLDLIVLIGVAGLITYFILASGGR